MMRRMLVRLLLVLALLLAGGLDAAWAQPAPAASAFTAAQRAEIVAILRQALQTDPSILRDGVTALQADEGTDRQANVQAAIEHGVATLTHAAGDPVAGNPDGDVTVVEFYDLRCPYCRRMLPVVAELLAGDPKLRLVYKDIPILGPASVLGARAVLAAQRQDGYLRLHADIMGGGPELTEDTLRDAATRAGLDWARLHRDMAAPDVQARIKANLELAQSLGIDGTPAYVIGHHLLSGAVSLAELRATVAAVRQGDGRSGP